MVKHLLIIYHSRTGATHQMVQALAQTAQQAEGLTVSILKATDAQAPDLLQADGYVFAAPENLGSMSGLMKDFFDRTYYPLLDQIQGRPYALLVCAGSDGAGAARQMTQIATGWRLKAMHTPVIVNVGAQTPQAILAPKNLCAQQLKPCAELGQLLGMGLSMSIF